MREKNVRAYVNKAKKWRWSAFLKLRQVLLRVKLVLVIYWCYFYVLQGQINVRILCKQSQEIVKVCLNELEMKATLSKIDIGNSMLVYFCQSNENLRNRCKQLKNYK